MRPFLCLALSLLLAGCAPPLSRDEKRFLQDEFDSMKPFKAEYVEFEKIDRDVERGRDFISYSRDLSKGSATPMMNPGYFWFKVSLSRDAIDPLDLQPPALTVYMPRFKKYFKLRLVTSNAPLMREMTQVIYDGAMQAGGTDPRWNTGAIAGPPGRMRRR
ncbi:MAG TPA: hypothetical protein VL404_09770 [Candidatus Eisenbacteria bacterium]|nr:hypothetical protein [Candidatus Eisenbacteria bacterium]